MRAAAAALAAVAATQVFVWQDPAIDESSGLVDLGATVVTTNDSGDVARLFVVDRRGRTVRTVDYAADVRDVEALAPAGDGSVWVADVGDNERVRDDLALHRVRLADGSTASFPVRYDDGRSYDAETLVALPGGRLAVVTKGLVGEVWLTPRRLREDRVNELTRVARVGGLLTDGARDPRSGLVVLRGYGGASVHELPSWRRVGDVPLPEQPQGEGISVGPGGRVRVSSEGAGTTVWQLPRPLAAYAPERDAAPARDDGVTSVAGRAWPVWVPWAGGGAVVVLVGVAAAGRRLVRRG